MHLITRYILWELIKVFFVALTAMTVLMMIAGLAQEALNRGLGPTPIIRLIPYVLPGALRFAVPGTILFATCSVFGRLSSNNEIVAIKSLGVSPLAVLRPALALAVVISCWTVWLNDVSASWGEKGIRRVVLLSVEEIAYGMLRTQRSYSSDEFSINVRRVEDRQLIHPTIVFHREGEPTVTLTAETAELSTDSELDALRIRLTGGAVDYGDKIHMVFPETIERVVPLDDKSETKSASDCAILEIPILAKMHQERGTKLRRELAAETGFALLSGDWHQLKGKRISDAQKQIRHADIMLHRLKTEPWRRWANGFSCLCFVMVGAPLAVRLRQSDLWTVFGTCFLPILLVYYPLLAFGTDRAKAGELPPYAVWLGNITLLVISVFLIRRMNRH